jgi:hypothetical protein
MRHNIAVPRSLIVAGLAAALAGCNVQLSMQAEARDQWQRRYTLTEGGTLEIHNTNGLIRVEPTSDTAVEISADRIVKAASDEAAKDALARWEIEQSAAPDRIVIDSSKQAGASFMVHMNRRADYRVRVPQWANLRLETTNGTIDITGPHVSGKVRAQTTNGNIKLIGLENNTTISTTNGAVTLEVRRLGDEGLSCETTNGSINVTVPSDLNARLSARVTNGGISAHLPSMSVSEESRRRLGATIGSGGPMMRLETTNGGVTVAAAQK